MYLAQLSIVVPLTNGAVTMVPVMAHQGTLDNQHSAGQMDQQVHRQPLGPVSNIFRSEAFWTYLPTEAGQAVVDMALPLRFPLSAHNPHVLGQQMQK